MVERAKDRERKRIARSGADSGSVRSTSRHVEAGCYSGTFVTVVEEEKHGKGHRRTKADDDLRERLIRLAYLLDALSIPEDLSDTELLTPEERTNLIEIAKMKIIGVEEACGPAAVKRGH